MRSRITDFLWRGDIQLDLEGASIADRTPSRSGISFVDGKRVERVGMRSPSSGPRPKRRCSLNSIVSGGRIVSEFRFQVPEKEHSSGGQSKDL